MHELLIASGPFPELRDRLMLYGQFVGSWDVEATWHGKGPAKTGHGEWHFGWILGGRGIQDVLFASGASQDQFGTTLRCYDAASDSWHITWMQPASGEHAHLVGRKVGDRIVQEGRGSQPRRRLRWSFADIKPNSFRWLGEVSSDGGKTWRLEQEMQGQRRIG